MTNTSRQGQSAKSHLFYKLSMFPVGLLVTLTRYILLIINWLGLEKHSFSGSPGNFLTLKILWNYNQEFIKVNGGQPIRLFHILI